MKILIIDDHALFREGMRHLLQQSPDGVDEIWEAENFPEGLTLAKLHPDLNLVFLELKSPGSEGANSIKVFRQHFLTLPLVVLSSVEDCQVIRDVLNNGANGFVCKSSSESTLLSALSFVLAGSLYVPQQLLHPTTAVDNEKNTKDHFNSKAKEYGLTMRQMDVLRHLALGLSNKEISEAINLAQGTVKVHLAALYQTLGVNKRIDAVQIAKRLGLIGVDYA